jgi:hypothetical protein
MNLFPDQLVKQAFALPALFVVDADGPFAVG